MAYESLPSLKGVRLGDKVLFDQKLARKLIPVEDRDELVQDILSSMHTTLATILPNTSLQHRYGFKLLPNGDLLLGLDPKEFIPFDEADGEVIHESENATAW